MATRTEADYLREWREDKRTVEALLSLAELIDGNIKTAMGMERGAKRDLLLDKSSGIEEALNHLRTYGKES